MQKYCNLQTGEMTVDRLHKSAQEVRCTRNICMGSVNAIPHVSSSWAGNPWPLDDIKRQAKEFLDEYYSSVKRLNSKSHTERWEEVVEELERTGTYNLTETELGFGAKLAWRNAVRCIGRIQWSKLQLFDARNVTTATEMFEALCTHLRYATNQGNIRSAITVFPQRLVGRPDFRVWNAQLLSYAGYVNPDGTILGDPINVEFTEVCLRLGWKGKGTRWDVLPWVLSHPNGQPEYFDIPKDLVVIVNITHPTFDWLEDMELQWYAVPGVSGMLFDVGGLEFTACPFNGWYMGTEVGCRDLADTHRYNILEDFASRMGLDTKNPTSLWKDKALVELNIAVLHSYQKAGVTLVDHHTASESFMKHYENEQRVRGGCPSDWVWIVPPMSGSLCPVFHLEMPLYHLKPSYEYQIPAHKTHAWNNTNGNGNGRMFSEVNALRGHSNSEDGMSKFKAAALAVIFSSKLFRKSLLKRIKATILYATETGNAQSYAKKLGDIFKNAFNANVHCMEDYDFINIEHESLVLVVAATAGNGDPPDNGQTFANSLFKMKMDQTQKRVPTNKKERREREQQNSKRISFIRRNSQHETTVASLIRKFEGKLTLDPLPENNWSRKMSEVMSDVSGEPLKNITFGVFALGSTAYPNFCGFGKYVDNLLGDLGGDRLMNVTMGDELSGQEETFRHWAAEIFNSACASFCLDYDTNTASEISSALKSSSLSSEDVRFSPVNDADDDVESLSRVHSRQISLYSCEKKLDLIKSDTSRATINVVLQTTNDSPTLKYRPGDHVGVLAANREEIVEQLLDRLINKPEDPDEPVQLELLEGKQGMQKDWLPHERLPKTSLRRMLSRYLDITSPPTPNLLRYFSRCAEDSEEADRLHTLAKDVDEYNSWKEWRWPHLGAVLQEFPSVAPDAGVLCSMLPTLQPRFYSVSSSPSVHPDQLHLTVAVVTYRTEGGKGAQNFGVCSSYLNELEVNEPVLCFIRTASAFYMPIDTTRPMIMIGPGTGIAPFRGFWQERTEIVKKAQDPSKLGSMTLFFGCWNKGSILYRQELETLRKDKILSQVHVAFSRDTSVRKTYVQDLIRREGGQICRQILNEGGHVYVCGDITMAEDVYKTLRKLIQTKKRMDDDEAESFMLSLRDEVRYHEDIFGITHRTKEIHDTVRIKARTRLESRGSIFEPRDQP